MSFNRSGYIGRAPGDSAITISKQYFQPTGVTTDFTFSSGYDPGLIDVYRNGIKLINVLDYAATDGSTISLSTPVGVGSTVQVVAYKAYNIATVKATELDTTVTGSTINLTGDITATNATISALTTTQNLSVSAAATVSSAFYVGSALTANAAGDVETIGIITASSFSGDGTGLSGVVGVGTLNVRTESLTVSGVSTLTGVANFSAAVNVDATTDSTSTSTGALIVDGGLGVAKNVYIGAGLSVAGTLTYEDVTNVDSVGMVTAKSGVNVSGGELNVGLGFSVGNAGIITSTGGIIDLKNSGSVSNIKFYCESSNAHYTALQSAAHSAYGGNVTLTLPATTDTLVARTTTDTLTNKTLTSPSISGPTVTGDLSIADKIIHTGDTNCAIRFPEADTITAETGGTERLRVVGSGVSILANGSDAVRSIRIDGTNGSSENGAFILENDGENAKANFKTSQGDGAPAKRLAITGLGDIEVYGSAAGVSSVTWDASANTLKFNDNSKAVFGDSSDLSIYHDGSVNHIKGANSRNIYIQGDDVAILNQAGTQTALWYNSGENIELYYANSKRFQTTNEGIEVTGFTSTTAGMGVTGGLFEGSFIKAGKLSDNKTLGISTANFFYFTTQETTTATPDIRWNDTITLSNKMAVGDVASVTVVTTAAAGGYSANWTIDGNAVTEEWVGGSAPTAGGSDGLDIYSLTIIKTGTGTGDSGFKVIANVSNAT